MKAATQMVVVEKKYGSTKQEVREVNFFVIRRCVEARPANVERTRRKETRRRAVRRRGNTASRATRRHGNARCAILSQSTTTIIRTVRRRQKYREDAGVLGRVLWSSGGREGGGGGVGEATNVET